VSGLRSLLRLSGAPLHGPAASSYPNGQTVAYDYYPNVATTSGTGNGDRRLKQIANSRSGALYSRFDYGYKVEGAINAWTKTLGTANPVDMGFTYDRINRLTGATYKDGAAVLAQFGYTYDKADNRTTERRDQIVSTASFNNVNELTALSGGGVVGFTGTTTEEAAVTVGGQVAQTSLVGTRFEKAVTLPAGTNTVTVAAVDPSGNTNSSTPTNPPVTGTNGVTKRLVSEHRPFNPDMWRDQTNNRMYLAWFAEDKLKYRVQTASDLGSSNWTNFGGEMTGGGFETTIYFTPTNQQSFYRIVRSGDHVIEAKYGAESTFRDVTTFVLSLHQSTTNGFAVGNHTLGGDPIFGKVKTLFVTITKPDGIYEYSAREGATLDLRR